MEHVVIVGGGPTGLMLACELRLAGADPLVLERLAAPSGESRAGGLHPRTLEILDMRGMLEPFLAEGRPLAGGHFGGIALDFSGLETAHPYLLVLLQRHTERLLEARARELGVRLRRRQEVTGLRAEADRVALDTTGGEVEARYVVGCDGGRSRVRTLAGIGFPGTPATLTAILGDVELAEPPEPVFQHRCEDGNYSVLPFEPGWYRVSTNEFGVVTDRRSPVTVDDLRAALTRLAGTDFGLHSPRWISRYDDAARLADTYRRGRVLLAGDAAHTHFPAGGQGLNTGLQDAVNLGWKLAAALDGDEDLLDTYAAERRPVAERVLWNTRAQTAMVRPGPQVDALREVFAGLTAVPGVNRVLAEMVTGLDVRYPLGEGAGHRAADVALPDGSRLYDHLRTPRHVLLSATPARTPHTLVHWAGPTTLVRPDGHVAAVGPGAGPRRQRQLPADQVS